MIVKPRIVSLGKHKLFLGITWLKKFNPDIDWQAPSLSWRDKKLPTLPLSHASDLGIINCIDYEINAKTNEAQHLATSSGTKKESDPFKAVPKKFLRYSTNTSQKDYCQDKHGIIKLNLSPSSNPNACPYTV
jgi:hypothetical protein